MLDDKAVINISKFNRLAFTLTGEKKEQGQKLCLIFLDYFIVNKMSSKNQNIYSIFEHPNRLTEELLVETVKQKTRLKQ